MKRFLALMMALLMLCMLAACTASESGVKEPGAAGTAPGSAAAPEVPAAAEKDTLVIGQYGDTPNFDTHNNLNDNGMRVLMCIYDPLVRMDSETLEIKPCVAESWSVSADGKEWTFKIKQGVKFNDGSDLTAQDVVFSVQRGIEMPLGKAVSFARVIGVEEVDASTVKIMLDGPYSGFLFAMALPVAGILSKTAYETLGEEKYMEAPITTGPYMVQEWKVGEKVSLKANPYYHEGEAAIKSVDWVVVDASTAALNLESGDLDAYVDLPQSSFSRVSANDNLAVHLRGAFSFEMIYLNMSKAPFNKLEARQAMAHAIDKESILYGIFDGNGEITDTFAGEEYVGYTDAVTKYAYDLDKAKALFEQAGVNDKTAITIYVCQEQRAKIAQVLQNSLAEIGIKAEIQQLERSAFDDAALAGDADIIVDGATFTAPTLDDAVYNAVHSGQMQVRNYAKYTSARADELLDTARTLVDEKEAAKLYSELLVNLSNDLPIIPTIWNNKNIAASAALKGVFANPWSFYNVYEFSW